MKKGTVYFSCICFFLRGLFFAGCLLDDEGEVLKELVGIFLVFGISSSLERWRLGRCFPKRAQASCPRGYQKEGIP